ncbi:DUF6538 domain-containing protein [Herbaspirillum camelliae]|uniref:DUF6538 domain-containing protein n=1 Tax=Herbaspirillum camelliae TaxID=1892903 RepID=UPI00117B7830|nr:DUF6538 domain-containing protein [Herbaspirillum camelliae]
MPTNLSITKTGIYKYRKVVPADVRHIIKKAEFKESLGGDRRLALVRHAELEAETTQLIYAARQQIDVTMPKRRGWPASVVICSVSAALLSPLAW